MMNITISSFFKSLTMFKFFALLLVLLWVVSDHMLLINTVWAAPEAVYLAMCSNATEFAAMEEYDYIIVGGGTAGCPLAATLSQKYRVILLERGGVGEGVATIANEQGFMYTLMDVDELESAAQAFTSEDGVANARGRVLGGSSAINAGFYSRAGEDYIREAGWDVALVNESYQWVENAVVFRPALRQWQTA